MFGGCEINAESDKVLINHGKEKLYTIENFKTPESRKEVQSFLGLTTQMSAWIPKLQVNLKGMRKLTGGNTHFL